MARNSHKSRNNDIPAAPVVLLPAIASSTTTNSSLTKNDALSPGTSKIPIIPSATTAASSEGKGKN